MTLSQIAAGRPYVKTSWGGFGPGFIWVQPSGGTIFDPANLQASVVDNDVTLTWDV